MGSKEDVALIVYMVDLYNVGTYNVDTGFKVDYLNELERMLEKVLPHAMLKAKPNLVSRIKTFKRDWAIVYDILSGKDNSDFDRAIGKNAQTAVDIVEEIDAKDVATTNNLEEGNGYHGCEDDVSMNEMDVSATQLQPLKPNHDGSIFSKKKKIFLMEIIGLELSRSIASEKVLQKNASRKCSKIIFGLM
ncbi:hypothetical protein Goklo_004404 [Gossypium klotzschianum]|uniref:Myb/SANT-like domain-containing protein n=1 Tax=Gossypium klotzschianum TaxID=34286 RepID=A0A7J8VNM0_9ROSI|nr:hypothetical protein [Gossypium klotzschianum]